MPRLSICIPVETGSLDPAPLVADVLKDVSVDLEVLVALAEGVSLSEDFDTLVAPDPRLNVVTMTGPLTTQQLWRRAVNEATGDWLTLVRPGDAIEAELVLMLDYLAQTSPAVDAFAWNTFQIDADAEPGKTGSVAIPASYHIEGFDKTAMLKSFFYWENSLQAPKMPFGLHHAAVRRSVVEGIQQLPEASWSTPVPQYEWAAKVLFFAEELAFCSRPLSAINTSPYQAPSDWTYSAEFPFHAGLGLTGAVAEVQYQVLKELGSAWEVDTAFVRACMIDCMMESERDNYRDKGNAYFAALQTFGNGELAGAFRPEFHAQRSSDQRRGLHSQALLVDRFLGGARTAPEFFDIARRMMAPIGLICGGVAR